MLIDNKFIILIVNYNQRIIESDTIKSLINSRRELITSKVYIWDNGPEKAVEDDLTFLDGLFHDFEYYFSSENKGLSYIYNHTIRTMLNGFEFLILLDNDSIFDESLFHILNNTLDENQRVNLFLPIICHDEIIVSPSNLYFVFMSRWRNKKYGLISCNNKFAINSGMTIRANYLLNDFVGYDERIKFYGTDDDFIMKFSKNNDYFFVYDYEFKHDFSIFTDNSIEKQKFRFKARKDSYRLIYANSFLKKIIIELMIVLIKLKLTIKLKRNCFLW